MNNTKVLWIRVWGIAGLQGAITLSWVVYNLYLPILLVQLGLDPKMAIAILIVENALEAVIEPVFGNFSDRQQQRSGTRMPIITIGIILSSALFLAFPSLVIFGNNNNFKSWLLPVLAVIWASVMAIFRSPAMAILGRCAKSSQLPQAASILTLVAGLVGAFRFDAYGIILQLGVGFAFAIGSFSLLLAGALLRWLNPAGVPEISRNQFEQVSKLRLGTIFVTGFCVGWGTKFLIPTVNQILTLELGENSKIAMTVFFIVLGLLAIPAGKIGTKLGNFLAMKSGCSIVVVTAALSAFVPNSTVKYIAIALLLCGYSLVLNGAIPYALSLAAPNYSGFGVGMYFGGLNAGVSLFIFIFDRLGGTNITIGAIGAILSFLLVAACLLFGSKMLQNKLVA